MGYIGKKPSDVPITSSDIPNLPASKITSGTLDNARITLDAAEIPNISTDKLTSGTLADARIADLSATKLTGTIDNARITLDAAEIPNISTDKLTSGTLADARIAGMASSKLSGALPAISGASLTALPDPLPASSGVNLTALNATNLGSGTLPDARFPATLPASSGVNLTSLNATNLGSGTVADARLPTTTVAKGGTNISSFAAGDILYATGSTTLAKLAKGSAADLLTMNAGATAPEWVAPAGGGGAWTETADVDVGGSAVSSVNVTGAFSSSYNSYRMIISGMEVTEQNKRMQYRWLIGTTAEDDARYKGEYRVLVFSHDNDSHQSTSNDHYTDTGTLDGFFWLMSGPGYDFGGSGHHFDGVWTINNPNDSNSSVSIEGQAVHNGSDATIGECIKLTKMNCLYQKRCAITGIQIFSSYDNIVNGNIRIYGTNV